MNAAVELFYDKVTMDPSLAGYFEGVDLASLKGHQRAFIAAALGGPETYEGRDMGPAHSHLGITDSHFDTVVGHLATTLSELGVNEATIEEIAISLAPLRTDIVSDKGAA
ncbi:MAG: group 1 truncated hemoglobin [Acidimicrobiaceae bacterium]|nr:group 1 truncated hemoglobin [Acidimicrobiaceae bacterium]